MNEMFMIFVLATLVPYMYYVIRKTIKAVHMLQLNSYYYGRYYRWMKGHIEVLLPLKEIILFPCGVCVFCKIYNISAIQYDQGHSFYFLLYCNFFVYSLYTLKLPLLSFSTPPNEIIHTSRPICTTNFWRINARILARLIYVIN